MAINDIYSVRKKKAEGREPDIYIYTELPRTLKVQIVHILNDIYGNDPFASNPSQAYQIIINTLCREYGVFKLPGTIEYGENSAQSIFTRSFLSESNIDKQLDYVELAFRGVDRVSRTYQFRRRHNASEEADAAIAELNIRFKEHGIGYQYLNGEIIRVDSELIHAEIVKPALKLLNQKKYLGAEEEFYKAYEHFRHGRNKEAINDALKSFESIMKAICEKNRWDFPSGAPAKRLINICLEKELIPEYWQQSFISLSGLLESSVPVGRNKVSGHGQGSKPKEAPTYLTAYILHMTAAAIVFLAEAENDML